MERIGIQNGVGDSAVEGNRKRVADKPRRAWINNTDSLIQDSWYTGLRLEWG